MVLITEKDMITSIEKYVEFPSPCGDYGSYLHTAVRDMADTAIGFRPLAGIMVLIFSDGKEDDNGSLVMFPSPCGDYGSYQK